MTMNDLRIIHADMDAFYAGIEQRDHPHLRGKPVVVGGDPNGRGVVSTASYEARKFGIHSAMSCRRAKRLCPHVIFVPVNMKKYKQASDRIYQIFCRYTDIIEPVSIDEAFLDVGDGDAVQTARAIKEQIRFELRLTVSIGVSYNKMLAKIASDMDKPDGFTVITRERAAELLPSMPIRKIWGVGPKTEKELNDIGIFTVSDLLNYDREFYLKQWGRRGYELLQLAQGIDNSPVRNERQIKSIGEETTLTEDTTDMGILRNHLKGFADAIGKRLRRNRLKYRTVTLKIKFSDFTSITRSTTLDRASSSSLQIYEESLKMLHERVDLLKPVRLIGIQVSNISYPDEPSQLFLFD
jgi:DNA polymerase-4